MPVDFQEEEPLDFVEETTEPLTLAPDQPARSSEELAARTWQERQKLYGPAAFEGPSASQGFSKGIVDFRFKEPEQGAFLAGAIPAAGNVPLSVLDFMTSPLGLAAALGAEFSPIAQRLISGGFSLDMLGHAVAQMPELVQKWPKMTPAQKGAATVNVAANLLGGSFLGKKAITGWGKQPGLAVPALPETPEAPLVSKAAEVMPRAAEEVAKPESPIVEPPVEPPKVEPVPPVEPAAPAAQLEVRTALKQEGLSDQEISDLLAGKASVSEIVGRKLRPFDVEYGGGPEHAKALEEARIQAVSRIENALKAQPEVSYLDEIVEYGGEKMPRGAVIRDLQQRGFDQQAIDRYMQGLDLAKEKGIADASRIETPTEVHGDVRPLVAPAQGVPVEEGGPRVQPQAARRIPKEGPPPAEVLLKPETPSKTEELKPDVPEVGEVNVRWGGSNREAQRQYRAFKEAGIQLRSVGAYTLGSKSLMGLIPNTPEAIALARKVGMTISRRQWQHPKRIKEVEEKPDEAAATTKTPAAPAEVPATPPPAGQPAAGAPPAATPAPASGAAGTPLRPGPGAATGGWTQTAIKTLSDEIARLPKSDARQKISFAEKWSEREARGRDLADRMVLRMAAVGASMKETMRGVRTPTELGNKIGELDYLTQQSTALGQQAKIAMQKAIPSQDMRNGLWLFADAHGDLTAIRDTLANLPADTKPSVRRALESALMLTDKEKAWMPFVREYYDIKAQEAQAAGALENALEDYWTHVWRVKDNMPAAMQAALNSGRVSEYVQFYRERKLPTMLEGIRNPTMIPGKRLEPVLDPADIVPYYNFVVDRALASRQFMKALDDLRASDGRPLLAPSGQGKLVTATEFAVVSDRTGRAVNNGIFKNEADAQALAGQTPDTHVEPRQNDFLLIKSKVTPKELAGYQAIDHPSMRKWRWADTGPDGKTVLYEGQLLAHPEAATRLRRMMDRSVLTPSPVMRAALRYSGEIKAAKLGLLSTFHLVHVGKHAIFHATNPFMPKAIDWESPQVRYAIEKGHLKLAANPSELNAFSEGILANEALVHKIPLIGPWSRALSEWLFTDYIPRLKMATFENALKGQQTGLVRRALQLGARQLSPDELAARVGDSVNSAFGELNQLWLGKNGRSPTLQRILRLAFLAPDFGEARLRFVGKAFTKYGSEERFALLMNAGLIYGLARIANWMVSGDPQSNDLRHAFDVKARIGGKDYWLSMRSVMTDLEHAFTNFSQFVRVRMNPAYSTPLIDFLTGTNWRGQKRTGMQWLQDRLAQLVPISLQSLTTDDQHLWQSLMASMGIQPRRGDAVSEMHERAKAWREARGIKDSVDVHESSAGNPYRQARIALEFNDARGFWRALQEQSERLRARETKAPMKTIESAFKRYYNAPFSGTKATEPAFLNSLPDRDRKVYQEALRERKRDWDKFQTWWQEHPTMLGQ